MPHKFYITEITTVIPQLLNAHLMHTQEQKYSDLPLSFWPPKDENYQFAKKKKS